MNVEPKVVMGGRQHEDSTSFKRGALAKYETSKAYNDLGVLWLCPTRGKIPTSVVVSFMAIQWPMNHFRTSMIASEGLEVSDAYNKLFAFVTNKGAMRKSFGPEYAKAAGKAPFILTTEEDNIIPYDAVTELTKAIYRCPDCGGAVSGEAWTCEAGHPGYDAVSGLYFVKTDPPTPMAFGVPNGHRKNFDFRPVSVAAAIKARKVIEVNGIAMGCTLWRKALFAKVSKPWFKTSPQSTQDLWFCKKAKIEAKARFGVHCGVRVGHLNTDTGQIF